MTYKKFIDPVQYLGDKDYKERVLIKGDYLNLSSSVFRGPVIIITDKPGEVITDLSVYAQPIRYLSSESANKALIRILDKNEIST